jgi:hypothetical protein
MFYLLKHFLLLNLVIFKLKCNNIAFNEILSLCVFVCVFTTLSLRRGSPDLDPVRQTPYF